MRWSPNSTGAETWCYSSRCPDCNCYTVLSNKKVCVNNVHTASHIIQCQVDNKKKKKNSTEYCYSLILKQTGEQCRSTHWTTPHRNRCQQESSPAPLLGETARPLGSFSPDLFPWSFHLLSWGSVQSSHKVKNEEGWLISEGKIILP